MINLFVLIPAIVNEAVV